ncbi:MAG: thiol-disulfide isomerase/thioredoxin [Saprospiraceae bacterium]|jgi:thiol-disulfide isomerase/thioredoxin
MKKYFLIFFFSFTTGLSFSQVKVYEKYDEMESELLTNLSPDTTYVINFWATWCRPCIKELPYFEELNALYEGQAFKQILVSLDDPKKLESKVIPFLKKNKIESNVVLLADGKANSWIDKVESSWSGAIPITLILRGNEKNFYEKEFHSTFELEEEMLLLFNN